MAMVGDGCACALGASTNADKKRAGRGWKRQRRVSYLPDCEETLERDGQRDKQHQEYRRRIHHALAQARVSRRIPDCTYCTLSLRCQGSGTPVMTHNSADEPVSASSRRDTSKLLDIPSHPGSPPPSLVLPENGPYLCRPTNRPCSFGQRCPLELATSKNCTTR